MQTQTRTQTGVITETIHGIVDRVTYHNPDNGWSVLRVLPFNNPHQQETVILHQTKVFAGATMEFHGAWTVHPKFGRQFKATKAVERKPATTAALEKYLGSGLIKGVGPKTAKKIVNHFGKKTLEIFEGEIERLIEIQGIAQKKLEMIKGAWIEHRAIREVMMFLQSHDISTLFAVRIYKEYGDNAIAYVNEDPYRLSNDFYGIGFFSADKVAQSIGLALDSPQRIMAAIKHVLAASREFGHCYLTQSQIRVQVKELIELDLGDRLPDLLKQMEKEGLVMVREIETPDGLFEPCYYSKSLYFDELFVTKKISNMNHPLPADKKRVERWIEKYCRSKAISLSDGQTAAVRGIVYEQFSILTGGPGCGKTTTTLVLVKLLEAMKHKVLLAAPTGRAAQRMMDVIGKESKTIHRLLEWQIGKFNKNEENPLDADFLIVDECSMLDINLTASLLKAVSHNSQVLFIGDADQLPSVGAGNVLRDMIASGKAPCFRLTKIFRQAQESLIIRYAHQINNGDMPYIDSPFKKPEIWKDGADCLFLDSDESTQEQLRFIAKIKKYQEWIPKYFGSDIEIQILTPMTRGSLGTVNLNKMIQESANPSQKGKRQLQVGERIFRVGDRVIHRRNNYDLGVFNGDIGVIQEIDNEELTCVVSFLPDQRIVEYKRDDIPELDLSYAITIHKSQGSKFGAVIIPILTQHFKMLFRNLIYTGLTRARKLAVLVGTRKALAMAVKNQDTSQRQTYLKELLRSESVSY